jgi:tetratricopeptide (TPR) repeat protein
LILLGRQVEGTTVLDATRFNSGGEARRSRLRSAIAWCCCAMAASAFAADPTQRPTESLAQRVVALAEQGKFAEVELVLPTLAKQEPSIEARCAAVLYASERAYAGGDRRRAAAWLKPLATMAPPRLRTAFADALVWCEVNPSDLKTSSARLLELVDQHGATSLAPVALQLHATALVTAKRPDEAIFLYHAALARFPKSRFAPAMLLAVAQLHHELKQNREAVQYIERLIADHADSPQVDAGLYLGVSVAQAVKQNQLAEKWLQQLVQEHESSDLWFEAACLLAEQEIFAGQTDAARRLIEKVSHCKSASFDARGRVQFLLLRAAVADNQWQEVEKLAEQLLAAKADASQQTLAQFWRAEAAYRRGQRETAFTRFLDLSLATEGQGDDWLCIVPLRLAQIEAQRQKWSAALERAEQLASEHPHYSRLHEVNYVHGRSLAALARFDEARDVLDQVASSSSAVKPETAAMAQWMIGETYFQQRRYDEAIAAYDRTQKCDFPQWRAAGLLQAAKCCEQLSRWSDAAQRYEQLLRDYGDSRYVAEAKTRLATTQQRAKIAAQASETKTR